MKTFEMPVMDKLDFVSTEEIAIGSGSSDVPHVPENPTGGWTITTKWCNHNTGHHSEMEIKGVNRGTAGEVLTMTFKITGFKLDYIKDNQGCPVTNVSENGFTITRIGHFNGNDNFTINIQIVVKDSMYEGSYGKTGVYCDCPVYIDSYWAG